MNRLIPFLTGESIPDEPTTYWKVEATATNTARVVNLTLYGCDSGTVLTVFWGDGRYNRYMKDGLKTHTYAQNGVYEIKIAGDLKPVIYDPEHPEWHSMPGLRLGIQFTTQPIITKTYKIEGITGLESVAMLFWGCSNITSIPEDLFASCTDLIWFDAAFEETGITSIPADLFRYNTSAFAFDRVFSTTPITSIPADLFTYNTSAVAFQYSFYNCTSLTGNAPELWNKTGAYGGKCFWNCTGLSNYSSIPDNWINWY